MGPRVRGAARRNSRRRRRGLCREFRIQTDRCFPGRSNQSSHPANPVAFGQVPGDRQSLLLRQPRFAPDRPFRARDEISGTIRRPAVGRFRRCSSLTYLSVCSLLAPRNRLNIKPPNRTTYFIASPYVRRNSSGTCGAGAFGSSASGSPSYPNDGRRLDFMR